MYQVEVKTKVVDGKELYSVYMVFRHRQRDVKFLLVPFPTMSAKQKMYFYDLLKKRVEDKPTITIKGNVSGAQ